MKASAWLFSAAMSVSSLALAQTATSSGVTETTDPAKIAEIERHAEQLRSGGQQTTTPMDEPDHAKKHGKRQHKNKAKGKSEAKDNTSSDTPMATESKK
jgi:hypothetical protein